MSKTTHRIYITVLSLIVVLALIAPALKGYSYYKTAIEERVFNPDHSVLKPSGLIGHGLGVIGSLCMIVGVGSYMARKRYRFLSRLGILKHWLEFHIFLCTLGPVLVLYHTAFKFGGLVAVSFWSMVAVFLSGIAGRFIYIQIPRSIEGRELTLSEIRETRKDLADMLAESYGLDNNDCQFITESIKTGRGKYYTSQFIRFIKNRTEDRKSLIAVRKLLLRNQMPLHEIRKILTLVRDDITISRRIERLDIMQNLFKYWHVAHLPFALVMLVIMVIHVGVTILFGYRWIF